MRQPQRRMRVTYTLQGYFVSHCLPDIAIWAFIKHLTLNQKRTGFLSPTPVPPIYPLSVKKTPCLPTAQTQSLETTLGPGGQEDVMRVEESKTESRQRYSTLEK